MRQLTFENFNLDFRKDTSAPDKLELTTAFEMSLNFASDPRGVLLIIGPSGAGKTHLAAAITNKLIETGKPVIYMSTPDLLDELRTNLPYHDRDIPAIFEQLKNIPVLILDDFGIQNYTPWAKEKIDQLITYRLHQDLPMVISTNTLVENMEDRLKTRLADPRYSKTISLFNTSDLAQNWPDGLALQKKMTFDNFDRDRINLPGDIRDNLKRAYKLAQDFSKMPEGWLILQGVTGCGKTHLAAAIVNYRYSIGLPAIFSVVPEFLDHLRSTFTPDSPVSYDNIFDRIKTAPFLVFDDFGEHATSPWAREKLYQVISYRYNAQLPTVITTRVALDELEPPISSRFIDHQFSLVFNITAPDYRGDSIKHKISHGLSQKHNR
jgi:DNA replication protein DnaC